jgi:hypothetical protein
LTRIDSIALADPDAALVAQSSMDLPWEQFIVSGPTTVALLGQLMVVSSKIDFSFRDYQPDYNFVYMRYPNSFRATLTQIANGNSFNRGNLFADLLFLLRRMGRIHGCSYEYEQDSSLNGTCTKKCSNCTSSFSISSIDTAHHRAVITQYIA